MRAAAYATYNIKGGAGKTTSTVNLGYLSAADGCRTLLWDLDRRARPASCSGSSPGSRAGKVLIRGTKALDDAIKGTDFENLGPAPGRLHPPQHGPAPRSCS